MVFLISWIALALVFIALGYLCQCKVFMVIGGVMILMLAMVEHAS